MNVQFVNGLTSTVNFADSPSLIDHVSSVKFPFAESIAFMRFNQPVIIEFRNGLNRTRIGPGVVFESIPLFPHSSVHIYNVDRFIGYPPCYGTIYSLNNFEPECGIYKESGILISD